MAGALENPSRDGLVTFLPHRLNRHPVVVRGLTADELWVCAGLSGAAGLVAGVPLAWLTHSIAMVPTLIVAGIGVGVFVGGGLLRRWKRGRPDTWLYRQLQWRLALAAHAGGGPLITVRAGGPRVASGPIRPCVEVQHEPIQERGRTPAGAREDLAPGRSRAVRRGAAARLRMVERAQEPDHPRAARPALGQHAQVVGRAAGESVYAFTFYIWQQAQRWPTNGEQDYPRNLHALSAYFTPSCRAFLQQDYEFRRNNGELRQRVRGIYEIPGRGYGDDPAARVRTVSANNWIVTLDVSADEYLGAEQVKRALVRYALKVVRMDVDPERNPFGLALDCHARAPERIEPPTPQEPVGTGTNLQGDTP